MLDFASVIPSAVAWLDDLPVPTIPNTMLLELAVASLPARVRAFESAAPSTNGLMLIAPDCTSERPMSGVLVSAVLELMVPVMSAFANSIAVMPLVILFTRPCTAAFTLKFLGTKSSSFGIVKFCFVWFLCAISISLIGRALKFMFLNWFFSRLLKAEPTSTAASLGAAAGEVPLPLLLLGEAAVGAAAAG